MLNFGKRDNSKLALIWYGRNARFAWLCKTVTLDKSTELQRKAALQRKISAATGWPKSEVGVRLSQISRFLTLSGSGGERVSGKGLAEGVSAHGARFSFGVNWLRFASVSTHKLTRELASNFGDR